MWDVQHFTDADDAQLQADDEHRHTTDNGRDDADAADAASKSDQASVRPAMIGHAIDQSHAADLRRRDRGTHECCRNHRWRHIP